MHRPPAHRHTAIAAGLIIAGTGWCASATADVVGWRTDWTGVYPKAATIAEWGPESSVVWATDMPAWSNATPVPVGNRLLLTAEPSLLLCVDAASGEIAWQKSCSFDDSLDPATLEKVNAVRALQGEIRNLQNRLGKVPGDLEAHRKLGDLYLKLAANEENSRTLDLIAQGKLPDTHGTNGYSTPTPVSDGEHVWVLFSTGMAACFDLDGNRTWTRLVNRPAHGWGHSASPVLIDGLLVTHIANTITAMDKDTGDTKWTATGGGTWGTPLPIRLGEDGAVITTGGDVIRTRDGKIIARKVAQLPWNGAVTANGVIYVVDERGAVAFRLPDAAADEIKPEVLWQAKPKGDRYYASPVVHDGLIYAVNQKGHFTVLDAADGTIVYEQALTLGGTIYPSPVLAGDRIIVSSDNGKMVVLQAGREYRQLSEHKLDSFRSCPIFTGGHMIVRTMKKLYCFGQ